MFGGSQYRPNLHIDDMTDLYLRLLDLPDELVAGKVWNAGYENLQVAEIAELVRVAVGPGRVSVVTEPTDDLRLYRVASQKIARDIGFVPKYSVLPRHHRLSARYRGLPVDFEFSRQSNMGAEIVCDQPNPK